MRWVLRNLVGVSALSLGLAACNSERLEELDEIRATDYKTTDVYANFCTSDASAVKSKLKFIFVLDKSGSNQGTATELGTDPDGSRRYDAIMHFLDQSVIPDPTISYALVNFSTNASRPGNDRFIDKAAFETKVINQKFESGCVYADKYDSGCPADGGWTNYLNAYSVVNELIAHDIQQAKDNLDEIESSSYVVFFVTDGAPITGGTPGNYIYQSTSDILGAVRGLKGLETLGENEPYVDIIQVHSLFYYNQVGDPAAETLLEQVADEGEGDFYSVSAGELIDFTRFGVPIREVKRVLRDVFVQNTNTTWENGLLKADSDGDTLSDVTEERLGSDPSVADTDGNGVDDGVEYRTNGKPCKDLLCRPGSFAEPYSSCTSFGDLDSDRLNDCEERVALDSYQSRWDSNSDWIPDGLAFAMYLAYSGNAEGSLDPDGDLVSTYQEVKDNTPPLFPNGSIVGLKQAKYFLTVESDDRIRTCYKLQVKDLAMRSDSKGNVMADLIRIWVVENTAVIDNKSFLKIAEKRVDPNGNGAITFERGDFQ